MMTRRGLFIQTEIAEAAVRSRRTMPIYHNSPPTDESYRKPIAYSRRPFSWKPNLWIEILAYTIVLLLSPILIPIFLVRLPFVIRSNYLKKKSPPPPAARIPSKPKRPTDPELVRRRELARQTNKRKHPQIRFLYDPINDDPTYAWAIKEAGDRANMEVGRPFVMGTCHRIWNRKKQILKEEFGIEWYSPREMNPGARFD